MSKITYLKAAVLGVALSGTMSTFVFAKSLPSPDRPMPNQGAAGQTPVALPQAPNLNAKAWILVDVNSGKIIAEHNSDIRLPPASLTKMMSLYVISKSLQQGQLKLQDKVHISTNAWKTGGSRMFIKEGDDVAIEDLVKGIIVDSGNDACVAMAEHIGGSEEAFATLMNQEAAKLGMSDSHFTDSTGLPDPNLYTTAHDLAILGRALVHDFPDYYHWYSQKWFTYNGIRQPNRNRLLWRNNHVDGIKTGHTNEAGFCLVSSAEKDKMRLLAVVLGEPNESSRADDSEKLLNYGFRFFSTHELYKSGQSIAELPIYKGESKTLPVGLMQDQFITIPAGQYQRLTVSTDVPAFIVAPVHQGDKIGELVVRFDDKVVAKKPLFAMQDVQEGGFFHRSADGVRLMFKRWIG